MKRSLPAKRYARPTANRRQARGLRTRGAILQRAVHLASVEGLEGLTVGRLAEELGMSKSGLFAHFGSKEDLQLATCDTARQMFIDEISRPAMAAPRGMPRLWNLLDRWLGHLERRLFEGGCFFTAASFEFDGRRGPVRERIAAIMHEWLAVLNRAVAEAQKAGHIEPHVDTDLLAYEIQSLALGAHWSKQLLDDHQAYARARAIMLEKLRAAATPECPPFPAPATRSPWRGSGAKTVA
jgi:AcrR family transcriptional regulator